MKYIAVFILLAYGAICAYAGIDNEGRLHQDMVYIISICACLIFVRQIGILILASVDFFRRKKRDAILEKVSYTPKVSIIVPAYNEAEVIEKALNSLLQINYPNYDILVIDDGSQDNTRLIANRVAKISHGKIHVHTQPNQGKSQALNCGVLLADADLVLCVDADSEIEPDGLLAAVKHFQDSSVAAVAGFVEVDKKQKGLIARLQSLEYLISQKLTRAALSCFRLIPIVPGPAGMFRRQRIIEAGGYILSHQCFAEDAELTIRLIAQGDRIVSEPKLISRTQVPQNISALLRQRYRWCRGFIQALFLNMEQLVKNDSFYGPILFMYLFIENVIFPLLFLGGSLFFLLGIVMTKSISMFLLLILVFVIVDLIAILFIDNRRLRYPITVLEYLFYRMSYSYLLMFWAFFGLIDELLAVSMSWDKLDRYNT